MSARAVIQLTTAIDFLARTRDEADRLSLFDDQMRDVLTPVRLAANEGLRTIRVALEHARAEAKARGAS